MTACMDSEMSLFESLRRRRKRRTLTFFEKILLLTYLYIHSYIQVHWHKLPEYAAHDRGLYHFYMYIQFIETLQILIKKWIENFTIEGRSQSNYKRIKQNYLFKFSPFHISKSNQPSVLGNLWRRWNTFFSSWYIMPSSASKKMKSIDMVNYRQTQLKVGMERWGGGGKSAQKKSLPQFPIAFPNKLGAVF